METMSFGKKILLKVYLNSYLSTYFFKKRKNYRIKLIFLLKILDFLIRNIFYYFK
jgi:hypothetical protein